VRALDFWAGDDFELRAGPGNGALPITRVARRPKPTLALTAIVSY